MLQVVSAAKWRVSGFLFLEPVRDQLACKHDLQSRHGVALAEGYRMTRGEIDYVASTALSTHEASGLPNESNVDGKTLTDAPIPRSRLPVWVSCHEA